MIDGPVAGHEVLAREGAAGAFGATVVRQPVGLNSGNQFQIAHVQLECTVEIEVLAQQSE